jgi:prevent-host-death family protein
VAAFVSRPEKTIRSSRLDARWPICYNLTMPDQIKDQARSASLGPGTAESWNLTDAKANLSRLVQRALEGRPQRIVRGGRESVVVVAEPDYDQATRRGRTAVGLFSALRGAGLQLERDRDIGRDSSL